MKRQHLQIRLVSKNTAQPTVIQNAGVQRPLREKCRHGWISLKELGKKQCRRQEEEKGQIKDLANGKGTEKESWPGQGSEQVASQVTTQPGLPGTQDFQD